MSTLRVNSITNGTSEVNFPSDLSVGSGGGKVLREYYSQTTEPTSAGAGAIWWNGDSSEIKVYLNSKWYTVTQVPPP